MKKLTKQEVQVWHILPAVRKTLSNYIVKEKQFTQKKAAVILEITEGAISQYLSGKRANMKLSKAFTQHINSVADKILKYGEPIKECEALLECEHALKIIKEGIEE